MKTKFLKLFLSLTLSVLALAAQQRKAPAYPLITHNPNFSIWSSTDLLNESATEHWTGAKHSLLGLINVDGTIYRFLGQETPSYQTILPTSDEKAYQVSYTENEPSGKWQEPSYQADNWKTGGAPIGDNAGTVKTLWKSDQIWVRRTFTLGNIDQINQLFLKLNHDDDIDVYLNGRKVYTKQGWTNDFQYIPLSKSDKNLLKNGENVIAIALKNTAGGRFLDFGLVNQEATKAQAIQVAKQKNVTITATKTVYDFTVGKVDLQLTFTSPLLLNDLGLLARPVSYINYQVQANDGKNHNVRVFLSASSDIAVYRPSQTVTAKKYQSDNLDLLKVGTVAQPILQKAADDMRIDWGYFYVGAPKNVKSTQFITAQKEAADAFRKGNFTSTTTSGKSLALNTIIPFGTIGKTAVQHFMEVAYDEIFAIQYFKQNLRPWWNTSGKETIEGQLNDAYNQYQAVTTKCDAFDKMMYAEAMRSGGQEYAKT